MKNKRKEKPNDYYSTYNNETKKKNQRKNNIINESDYSQKDLSKTISSISSINRNKKGNQKKSDNSSNNQSFLGYKHKSNYSPEIQKNKLTKNENKKNTRNSNDYNYKSPKKLQKSSFFSDTDSNSIKLFSNDSIVTSNSNITKNTNSNTSLNTLNTLNTVNRIKEEDKDYIVFPYEYTEQIISALSCSYCKGIYIKPYVINLDECMHIFCLGCIMKIIEDKEIAMCPKCNAQFYMKNIKYSEVTDFYIKTFFPQIPSIIEENNEMLNEFMERESKKYSNSINIKDEQNNILRCELRPYRMKILQHNKLPEITNKSNKFKIEIKSDNENIVSTLKKQTIKRLNCKLKEEEIEIRCEDIELSQFKTYNLLKGILKDKLSLNGFNIFYYNKK